MLLLTLLLLIVKESMAVIYSVNESEYYKMPPLFAMDDYDECLLKPGDTYCLAEYDLYSRGNSNLMHFIQEYSAYTQKHFNYTHIHRAICLMSTCRNYINDTETTPDLEYILERCLNESIWNNYQIEAKIAKINYCKKYDEEPILDLSDYIVAIVYAVIIMCNIIGSFYDIIFCKEDNKKGNPYLLALSLKKNWSKLIAPSGCGSDPRLERLKLFNGFRTLTMICVIFSHAALIMSFTYIKNPHYVEKAYNDIVKQLLYNGSLVTHTFFVMSSFLLAYNLQIQAEKHQITWVMIPKGILMRWLRLTPSYALIIATISTWMRHLGTGPLWNMIVTTESQECRQNWWANIFYFNNYVYKNDLCFPQGWYLAADSQLFCFALILFVIIQDRRHRKIVLILLFIASLVITASHTYFQNLDAVVMQAPESYRTVYANDNTFRLVYIRGHTNLSTYVLGLAGGLLCYKWQTDEKDMSRYKKYRWLVWLIFPAGVAVILSGGIFYIDGYTPSTLVTVVYATVYKPIFQILIVFLLTTCIFRIENIYRSILEWRGFTWSGRVSYSAYLLHGMIQRSFIGSLTTTLVLSDYYIMVVLCTSVFLSFVLGVGLWLFVEAPVAGLMRALLAPTPKTDKK